MYVGKLPNYFPLFMASCFKNTSIDFVVCNDTFTSSSKDRNVSLVKLSLADFNSLASQQLNFTINVTHGWKINELKPAFGVIFYERLQGYDFWAWSDIDIIWGDLRAFLTEEVLNEFDVVVPKEKWTAGHFTLFRNIPFLNKAFEYSPSYKIIFLAEKYTAFEESCHRWEGEFFKIADLQKEEKLVSMYDVVRYLESENKIRVLFKDIIREHPQPINYRYVDGKWIDNLTGDEFMYYHLLTVKKIWRFYIPNLDSTSHDLWVTPFGIKTNRQQTLFFQGLGWWIKRVGYCTEGILLSLKKEGLLAVMKRKLGLGNAS